LTRGDPRDGRPKEGAIVAEDAEPELDIQGELDDTDVSLQDVVRVTHQKQPRLVQISVDEHIRKSGGCRYFQAELTI